MRDFSVRLLFLPFLIAALIGSTFGQNDNAAAEIAGLVLEVTHSANGPTPLVLNKDRPTGFWTANIPHLKDWKPPQGFAPVQAVNFEARLTPDGKAEVRVTVFRGQRFREREDRVATYLVSLGETVMTSDLKGYGFAPVPMKLVAVRK
ncbi:MAG TPA: hypothetical protein VGI80_06390, partial [Pyrinomonadaceae bacterium]